MTDPPLACIRLGKSTVQGELIKQWTDEHGKIMATVSDGDRVYTGELVSGP